MLLLLLLLPTASLLFFPPLLLAPPLLPLLIINFLEELKSYLSSFMDYYMSSPHDPLKRSRWEQTTTFYPRFCGGSSGSGATTLTATPPRRRRPPPPPPPPLHRQPLLSRPTPPPSSSTPRKLLRFSALDDEMACAVVPPVTVVLEGRSICHRIHLHKHQSYASFAAALRNMLVDVEGSVDDGGGGALSLSNAVPGYMVAYEDMEDDLLLAGDLSWKDFVRVVKRIRILPLKPNRRKNTTAAGGMKA